MRRGVQSRGVPRIEKNGEISLLPNALRGAIGSKKVRKLENYR